MQVPELRPDDFHPAHPHVRRRIYISRSRLILAIICLCLVIGITLAILNALNIIHGVWFIIVPVIFTALALLIASLQWLRPINHNTNIVSPDQSIGVGVPSLDSSTVWCEREIRGLYKLLGDPETSAVFLKGIQGVGKSMLANLMCQYIEEQRLLKDKTLWFSITPDTQFSAMAEVLAIKLRHRFFLDFNTLDPLSQASHLMEILEASKTERLIVLDFKTPLDGQGGTALADRLGFKEWLRALNDRPCSYRVLFTNRPWRADDRGFVLNHLQDYSVKGLEVSEVIELLAIHQVKASDKDAHSIIDRCDGHAGALGLLSIYLHEEHINLAAFLEDDTRFKVWMREATKKFIDPKYQQLDPLVQKLLFAFSVYRRPVQIKGALAILPAFDEVEVYIALPVLINQHLLLPAAEEDHYRLPAIVAGCVYHHASNVPDFQTMSRNMHHKAAEYCQEVANNHSSSGHRSEAVELWREAAWHFSQAGKEKVAYDLLKQKDIFKDIL